MEENIITLVDETGVEHEFALLEIVEIDEVSYAVLLPREAPEEGVVVLKMGKDSDGEDVLMSIDDDDEFEKVREVLEDLAEEE
ncbi:MAG: DUF1292 domain-containing protein [Firmicutes bacterium]|nr:DUF1292 domain-containing protein [Bacillota bacterium]